MKTKRREGRTAATPEALNNLPEETRSDECFKILHQHPPKSLFLEFAPVSIFASLAFHELGFNLRRKRVDRVHDDLNKRPLKSH